jgi:hypothetical protein
MSDDPWVNEYLKGKTHREEVLKHINHEIGMAGSESRTPVLLWGLNQVGPKEGNELLREWFSLCEAIGEYAPALREHFIRCGYVTDTPEKPDIPGTIYRAQWDGGDPEAGLSWTTDLEFAKKFARMMFSIRGRFLGLYQPDCDALIWEATCEEALAYFQGRDEHEVIPAKFIDPMPILSLSPA